MAPQPASELARSAETAQRAAENARANEKWVTCDACKTKELASLEAAATEASKAAETAQRAAENARANEKWVTCDACKTKVQRALLKAIESNSLRAVESAVKKGADPLLPGEHANTPLHIAAMYGSLRVIGYLCEARADLTACNRGGRTPLESAQKVGEPKAIAMLQAFAGGSGLCAALAWSPGEARRLSFHQFCTFGAPDAAAAASDGAPLRLRAPKSA
ncbi:hypothetical protein EMIHUDRAFT_246342 [Emiliania huxleyi CCMP1516]|uniref:Uncharacterized protein n=2 Tax=Emiliania huxleyi TaxID=2903 RepID=A0A0D3ISJ2_EMIH1|nr:hypothetical protein EMIHUDRAFT_246342 [Emiliania huxleyi CCMP1516]EOD14227.1 hypothetical protein EMIHUDRAFT_246342 [Emiliania huxleyi CCMP1516]|eukprot:XP_005766656.1 hypothetical protein EMIHUDRAFT_246342 [Emiliania huxleyi CCMP1516]